MQTFKHPSGYFFDCPDDWQVEAQGGQAVTLLPADVVRDASGEFAEIIAVSREPVRGITRADDPHLINYFIQQSGGLQPINEPQPIESRIGPGIRIDLAGIVEGTPVKQQIHAVVHDDTCYFVLHVARDELLAKREAEVRNIFTSLAYEEPAADAQIVGTWVYNNTSGSTDVAGGGLFATDTEAFAFLPEGRVERGASTHIGGTTSAVSVFSEGGGEIDRGSYQAAAGLLTVKWDNGNTGYYDYKVFPHEGTEALKLQEAGEKHRFYLRN